MKADYFSYFQFQMSELIFMIRLEGMYCIVLYCIVLYCIVLYCIVL